MWFFALELNCYENSETQRPHNAQEGNNQRVIILDTDGFDYTAFLQFIIEYIPHAQKGQCEGGIAEQCAGGDVDDDAFKIVHPIKQGEDHSGGKNRPGQVFAYGIGEEEGIEQTDNGVCGGEKNAQQGIEQTDQQGDGQNRNQRHRGGFGNHGREKCIQRPVCGQIHANRQYHAYRPHQQPGDEGAPSWQDEVQQMHNEAQDNQRQQLRAEQGNGGAGGVADNENVPPKNRKGEGSQILAQIPGLQSIHRHCGCIDKENLQKSGNSPVHSTVPAEK